MQRKTKTLGKEKDKMKDLISKYLRDDDDGYASTSAGYSAPTLHNTSIQGESFTEDTSLKSDRSFSGIQESDDSDTQGREMEPFEVVGADNKVSKINQYVKSNKKTRLTVAEFKAILKEQHHDEEGEKTFLEKSLLGKFEFITTLPLRIVIFASIPQVSEDKLKSIFACFYPATSLAGIITVTGCK